MDSQPFDPSDDPFLGFTSELPNVPTPDSEPAFTRTQTLGEEQHSIALRNKQGPSQRVGLWFATVSVVSDFWPGSPAVMGLRSVSSCPPPFPRPSACRPAILKPRAIVRRKHVIEVSSRLPRRMRAPSPLPFPRLNHH
jgi:hypothetical protein